MHRITGILFFLCALCLTAGAQAGTAALDQDNGCLGFPLGARSETVNGIKSSGKSQGLNRAVPTRDSLKLYDVPLKTVRLFFFRTEMHSIELKTTGAHSEKLIAALEARYGAAVKNDNFGASRGWTGDKVILRVEMNLVTKDATFTFCSREVNQKYYKFVNGMGE